MYNRRKVEMMKARYPEGTRICLDNMGNDPQPIPSGTKGTVIAVDDAGQLLMKWDNGRSLSLIPGEDSFHKIQEEVQTEEISEELAEEPEIEISM